MIACAGAGAGAGRSGAGCAAAATGRPQPSSQISLSEAGRAIAAGRLDQAKAMLGVAVAAGAKGEPVDRLLADLAFARGENDQRAQPLSSAARQPSGRSAAARARRNCGASAGTRRRRRPRCWIARRACPARAGGRGMRAAPPPIGRAAGTRPTPPMRAPPRSIRKRAEIANNQGWSLMLRGRWAEALAASSGRLRSIRACRGWPIISSWRAPPSLPTCRRACTARATRPMPRGSTMPAWSPPPAGRPKRAEAAFAQAIELRSRWYARAADNLAALGARQMTLLASAPGWLAAILLLLLLARGAPGWLAAARSATGFRRVIAIGAFVAVGDRRPGHRPMAEFRCCLPRCWRSGHSLFGRGWMGGGDIKLLAASALWFDLVERLEAAGRDRALPVGSKRWSSCRFAGCHGLTACAVSVLLLRRERAIPYGIAIALGVALMGWWLRA